MHIPDGYLGPATCGIFYAAMLPIWAAASRIVKKTLKALSEAGHAEQILALMVKLDVERTGGEK